MAKYKVEISGIDTSDISVLSNEEMKSLFVKMKCGDLEARNLLIEGNIKLVAKEEHDEITEYPEWIVDVYPDSK